ncbi:MAG: S-layer homology domain-containing protein, partial [Clostridia bacterium]|nr:S-layer homology domain-containing protein [Clostridia bacterium]
IAVYGFETDFSIDADTGELLTYYGNKITDRSIKYYTDLNDQWYADYASKLAYMGYYFDSDTFDGDSPLTYGALKELNNSSLYGSLNIDDKEPDDKITRYEFAEYLVDSLKIKNVNKYNEIYIKPFDDVAYQYTGTIAILKAMGVVNGESFRGNDTITRGEAVTMLYRTLTVL